MHARAGGLAAVLQARFATPRPPTPARFVAASWQLRDGFVTASCRPVAQGPPQPLGAPRAGALGAASLPGGGHGAPAPLPVPRGFVSVAGSDRLAVTVGGGGTHTAPGGLAAADPAAGGALGAFGARGALAWLGVGGGDAPVRAPPDRPERVGRRGVAPAGRGPASWT